MLESIILGMVLDADLTGYDIKKRIENGIGVLYKASYGSLYPALKRVSAKGYLTTYEHPHGGRQKIFYHLTVTGRQQFFEWLCAPVDVLDGANTHLAKVYFFDHVSPEIREQQLWLYEMHNRQYLKKLEDLETVFSNRTDTACWYYKLATLYYGICITQRTIEWCQHIRLQKPLPELIGGE